MEILDVSSLRFSYDGRNSALVDASFVVEEESIVGLVGPNGSGKSTLIKIVFDLLAIQAGQVRVAGKLHSTRGARNSSIYLASNDSLPQFLTGYEYLQTICRLYNVSYSRKKSDELLKIFSLAGRGQDLIEDYSHGMRKKIQLVSSFMVNRPLTVVDETLNGIDLDAIYSAEKRFVEYRNSGGALLLCTHDFALLDRISDRIVMMDHGCVVFDLPTSLIASEYGGVTELVARYLRGGSL